MGITGVSKTSEIRYKPVCSEVCTDSWESSSEKIVKEGHAPKGWKSTHSLWASALLPNVDSLPRSRCELWLQALGSGTAIGQIQVLPPGPGRFLQAVAFSSLPGGHEGTVWGQDSRRHSGGAVAT